MTARQEIGDEDVLAPLRRLMSRASPHGEERALAEDFALWAKAAVPDATWTIDPLDDRSANLFARSTSGSGARELAMYGHLDTSLTGGDRDLAITDAPSPAPALVIEGREVRGFGVGVAKGPSAAAVAAFAAVARELRASNVPHRLTLLLAAEGTHRAAPAAALTRFGRGVSHAMDAGWRPDAVLNVKAGPRGVLYEEPAAAYLRVTVHDRWDAVLARRIVAPDGGLARQTGAVIDAVEEWRTAYLSRHSARGQLAPEIAVGAIEAGSAEKPDLLAGRLALFVYVVLLPGDDPLAAARDLEQHLGPRVKALPRSPSVRVEVYAASPGGTTPETSDIVRLAAQAWRAQFGDTPPVREWSGATDGAIFLASGIPTARVGPQVRRDANDPRIEILSLDDLVKAARAYAATARAFFGVA